MNVGDGWSDAFSGEAVINVKVPANDVRILRK